MAADHSEPANQIVSNVVLLGAAHEVARVLHALPGLRLRVQPALDGDMLRHARPDLLLIVLPGPDPAALSALRTDPALQDCAMVALAHTADALGQTTALVEFDDVIDLAVTTPEALSARIAATLNGARVRARRNRRYRLLQRIDDRFRNTNDVAGIPLAAAAMLGRHLDVNRCAYADVEADEDTFNLTGDYNAGVHSIVGRYRFADFGQDCLGLMRQGLPYVVEDSEADLRTQAVLASYRQTAIRAVICVPVLKNGRFVAAMAVHMARPRRWHADEVSLVQTVAERCWESIERGRIARELQARDARYRTLVETMSAVVWQTDGTGHVRAVNPTWSAFTGQVFDEYEGEGWLDALHPDDRVATVQTWREATAARHPFVGSYRLRRHDGQYRHMLARGAAVMAGGSVLEWVGSCLDVTDMRTAQEALRAANVRLQFTLDSAQIADWDYDPATGLLAASPRLARVFGYDAPQPPWDMRHLLGHIHGEDRAVALGSFEKALRTAAPWHMECRIVQPDGAVRWVAVHGNSYRGEESAGARMLGIVYDITAHKRSEQALREADQRKDEFLAMLAHELRNPLAPIGAASEVLAVGGVDPTRTGMATAVIRRQVRHMSGLIDDLLDVSRVKRGLVKLETAPCDMGAVVAGALEQVRPLLDRRGHTVHVDLPELPATVNGDEKRLVQIVANLLNNAAKYTPDRGRIAVAVALCGAAVTCTVTDNGIGMSPDFVERAFDVFAQADQSIARSQGGLGLGLALARSLVAAHGGSIGARSEGPGKGAAFTVTLPAL